MLSEYIRVYCCPNESCSNYYGSSGMPAKLEDVKNMAPNTARDRGEVRSTRATCPDCGAEREERIARLIAKA
jgi:hypothetical protein